MPHALLTDFRTNISEFVASQVGRIKAMIYIYANNKLNEILNELLRQCPPPEALNRILKQKEAIETLANSFDSKIQRFQMIPQRLDKPILAGKVIVEILSHMPMPSTIGTPPGPAGGVIYSVPTGVIQSQSNLLVFSRKMIETLEDNKVSIEGILTNTSGIFDPILTRLKMLDRLVQDCVNNPDAPDDQRARVIDPRLLDPNDLSNRNLLANSFRRKLKDGEEHDTTLEQDIENAINRDGLLDDTGTVMNKEDRDTVFDGIDKNADDESYRSSNDTVYTIRLENDPSSPPISPRRRAIAVDFRGITVLKGPFSFASSDKILKDELKFRIDNQLP